MSNDVTNEKTVIVISHRLSATSMCDKIFVIDSKTTSYGVKILVDYVLTLEKEGKTVANPSGDTVNISFVSFKIFLTILVNPRPIP